MFAMSIVPTPTSAEMRTAYAFTPWINNMNGNCFQFSYYTIVPSENTLALFIQDIHYTIHPL